MPTLKFAILFFLLVNLGNCQEIVLEKQMLTTGRKNGEKNNYSKTLKEISLNVDAGLPKSLGNFNSICTKGKLSFDFGVKTLIKDRYDIFLNFEYMLFKNENHPASSNHLFEIKNFTTGLLYRVINNTNSNIEIGIGLGPYIYERAKDNQGAWVLGVKDVYFGGKILASINTPLGKYVSLEFRPSVNAFKSDENGWFSYLTASVGIVIVYPI
ncbi:MAG: hypothetical protein LWX07_00965 [Bacteroidetes bacterium]|nr:hypothetical protein [Bacteroidota bacterium]